MRKFVLGFAALMALAMTAMAAEWVQAIWTANAPSISSGPDAMASGRPVARLGSPRHHRGDRLPQ